MKRFIKPNPTSRISGASVQSRNGHRWVSLAKFSLGLQSDWVIFLDGVSDEEKKADVDSFAVS